MHCTRSAAPVTEEVIRRIVPELRARGYRFVKVSELMSRG
ncbi:lipoprotein [Streptomyces narbonensis]